MSTYYTEHLRWIFLNYTWLYMLTGGFAMLVACCIVAANVWLMFQPRDNDQG